MSTKAQLLTRILVATAIICCIAAILILIIGLSTHT